ncbi:unnamed protein product, partial [Effrenium voratum]
LLGVAGYLVFLAGREGASAREVRRLEALARLLEGQEVQLLETLTTCERRPADAWRLFSAETLKTRSFCLHGVCPQLPEQPFLIDPAELRFSHPAISPQFRSGLRLAEAAQRLVSGAMRKRDFAKLGRPLPVRWHKGAFHTLGNRRLAVYRLFKFFGPRDAKVLVRRVNEHEALRWPWHRKFEVDDHQGRRIRVRELEAWIGETLEVQEHERRARAAAEEQAKEEAQLQQLLAKTEEMQQAAALAAQRRAQLQEQLRDRQRAAQLAAEQLAKEQRLAEELEAQLEADKGVKEKPKSKEKKKASGVSQADRDAAATKIQAVQRGRQNRKDPKKGTGAQV